jgi:hypothetical protein
MTKVIYRDDRTGRLEDVVRGILKKHGFSWPIRRFAYLGEEVAVFEDDRILVIHTQTHRARCANIFDTKEEAT